MRQPARVVFDSRRPPAARRRPSCARLGEHAGDRARRGRRRRRPRRRPAGRGRGRRAAAGRSGGADRRRARALGASGVQSLFVEGGAGLAGAHGRRAGAVDRVAWFLAPMLIGGARAPPRRSAGDGRGDAGAGAAPARRRDRAGGRATSSCAGGCARFAGTGLSACSPGWSRRAGGSAGMRPADGGARLWSVPAARARRPRDGRLGRGQRRLPHRSGDRRRTGFAVDCVAETLRRTTLGGLAAGDRGQPGAPHAPGRPARRPSRAGARGRRRHRARGAAGGRAAPSSRSPRPPRCCATSSRRAASPSMGLA